MPTRANTRRTRLSRMEGARAARQRDGVRIGYAPITPALTAPGDRRRFPYYARARGIEFDIARRDTHYDLVVLTEVADLTYWLKAPRRTRVIYDLIDSYLAQPRRSIRAAGRGAAKFMSRETHRLAINYRKAIEEMCRRADAVVCATDEQRSDISRLCPNVHVILDIHEEFGDVSKADYALNQPPRLVWEGLPYTLDAFRSLAPALRVLQRRHQFEMHLVTDPGYRQYARRFIRRRTEDLAANLFESHVVHPWSVAELRQTAISADLALLPARLEDPFSAGKPENRLLIFWRLGVPTVAAATPAYSRAMKAAGLDLHYRTSQECVQQVEECLMDEGLRTRAAARGREFVLREHPTERRLEGWDEVLSSVGFGLSWDCGKRSD